jgi:hypothetical protein
MNREQRDPRQPNGPKQNNGNQPDMTPRREGGDDSLAEASPTDNRADEKVIVNEQRENKTVNVPSQTAVNTSEQTGNDEEVL